MPKVKNLINAKGNVIANQFVITDDNCITFQSYDSTICEYYPRQGKLFLGDKWDYSNTTMRAFKQFVNEYTCFTYESANQWRKLMATMPIEKMAHLPNQY